MINQLLMFVITSSPCRKSCVTLLEMGADINSPDTVGWTPLLWGAKVGNVGVVELLLERGAGVLTDHVDIDGNAALHVAAHFNQVETTRILMNYGASLLLLNKRGMTCFDVAMEAQNNEVVMVIVKHQRYCTLPNTLFVVQIRFHFFFSIFGLKIVALLLSSICSA